MALPTVNISMSAIQTEFGGSNPIALSEYYGVNANVASSGTIRMAQFLGISNFAASLPSAIDPSDFAISPTDATARLRVYANGTWQATASGGNGTWKTGGGSGSDYDIRYTKTSGTTPTGSSVNTWLNLASTADWILTESTNGNSTKTCSGTLEIRLAASPFTVLDSCTLTMTADVDI